MNTKHCNHMKKQHFPLPIDKIEEEEKEEMEFENAGVLSLIVRYVHSSEHECRMNTILELCLEKF